MPDTPVPVFGSATGEDAARVAQREAAVRAYNLALARTAGYNDDQVSLLSNRGRIVITSPAVAPTNTNRGTPGQTHDLMFVNNVAPNDTNRPPFTASNAIAQAAVTLPDGRVVIARRGILQATPPDGPLSLTDQASTQYFNGRLVPLNARLANGQQPDPAAGTYQPVVPVRQLTGADIPPAAVTGTNSIFTAAAGPLDPTAAPTGPNVLSGLALRDNNGRIIVADATPPVHQRRLPGMPMNA